jgi:Peptidase family S41
VPIIAKINDTHTNIRPFIPRKSKPKVLPLLLRQFDNQFYIHYNASNDSTILRTSILKAINNVPMDVLYEVLGQQVGVDNGNEVSKKYYLTNSFNAYYFRYFGHSDSLALEILLPNSSQTTHLKIATLTGPEMDKNLIARYKLKVEKNFGYNIVDTLNKAAILKISTFKAKKNFLDIAQFQYSIEMKRAFKQILKDSIQSLAIDFRGNGGGFIPNVHRTIKYFINEPVSLISKIKIQPKTRWKLFPIWMVAPPILGFLKYHKKEDGMLFMKNRFLNKIKPSKHRFKNDLYFMTDGGSYSATCMTLTIARDQKIGKIIGTRAGGANWGSFAGTWTNITLPNSKITSHIPLQKIEHFLPNQVNKSFFIEPDIKIEPSFEMFMKSKDTVKEAFIQIVKTNNK